MEYNDIEYIGQGIGIVGLMWLYIRFKVWMYKKEYQNDKENTKERKSKGIQ